MKTKFRPSTAPDKTEPVMYQLIHEQITGKIRDGHDCPYGACPADQDRIGTVLGYNLRHEQLASIRLNVEQELQRLKRLANELDKAVEHRQKSVNGTKKATCKQQPPVYSISSVHRFGIRTGWARYAPARPIRPRSTVSCVSARGWISPST